MISRVQRYKGPFVGRTTLKQAAIFSNDVCVQNNSSVLVTVVQLTPEMFLEGIEEAFDYSNACMVLTHEQLKPVELASKA